MSTPLRNDEQGLSRREELTVSTAAMADVPWAVAGAAGVVVTGADLLLHLMGGHVGLTSSLSAGTVALFTVAGGSVVVRRRASRAARWARTHPWRFAVLPGAATAVIVFVLSVIASSGPLGGAFTALWHGAIAFGLTGGVGATPGSGTGHAESPARPFTGGPRAPRTPVRTPPGANPPPPCADADSDASAPAGAPTPTPQLTSCF